MRRFLAGAAATAAFVASVASPAWADAGNGNQPSNPHACAGIQNAAEHTPGAANGSAIGPLLVTFCL
jgi:hypothetical protein